VEVLAGPFAAVAAILAVGGAAKALRPDTAAHALSALGFPRSIVAVRLLGAAEVAMGAGAMAVGGRLLPALVASAYLGFAAFVVLALARGVMLRSCGCFGQLDTPPTAVHVVVNLAAAVVAGLTALGGGPGLGEVIADQPFAGVPFLLLTAGAAYAMYLVLAVLPQTTRAALVGRQAP
jgi:hypothetical protein